jgi:hypothetical protein
MKIKKNQLLKTFLILNNYILKLFGSICVLLSVFSLKHMIRETIFVFNSKYLKNCTFRKILNVQLVNYVNNQIRIEEPFKITIC